MPLGGLTSTPFHGKISDCRARHKGREGGRVGSRMSIVACVNVHDAVVFGSDSITTITGPNGEGGTLTVQSYRHAQKLHRLSQHVAVATWGAGNIGGRSIMSIASEYARSLPKEEHQAVDQVAEGLLSHMRTAYRKTYNDQTPSEIGVMIGGYSPDGELAEIREFTVPNDNASGRLRSGDEFGASWRGVSVPFARLTFGVDPFLRSNILSELNGDPERQKRVETILESRRSPFVFDGMPIQEAVDFVVFILRTTIDVAKFEAGLQSCGGPLWVCVITRGNGFQWVQQPALEIGKGTT